MAPQLTHILPAENGGPQGCGRAPTSACGVAEVQLREQERCTAARRGQSRPANRPINGSSECGSQYGFVMEGLFGPRWLPGGRVVDSSGNRPDRARPEPSAPRGDLLRAVRPSYRAARSKE